MVVVLLFGDTNAVFGNFLSRCPFLMSFIIRLHIREFELLLTGPLC